MFEAHVLHLLQRYLGEYVRGLSLEALKISVWQGDVVLRDLQLKAEALNALKLPITVKAGFLGSIRLKVPWNRLGKEPVVVLLDRIFILAEPLVEDHYDGDDDEEKKREAKRRRVEEAELAMLEARDKKAAPATPEGGSWIGSLLATIVGNLKLSITNVHIRYEDTTSNVGHPFCAGITLAKLAAVTTDDNGVETFVASGALDRLRKAVELERLAVYHDSNSTPWKVPRKWEDMSPAEWSEIFEPGISGGPVENRPRPGLAEALPQVDWAAGRHYLLQPIGGKLQYLRRGKQDARLPHEPFQRAAVVLDEVALTVSEAQYCDVVKMLERISEYRARTQYAALRPRARVHANTRAWWQFAYKAVLQNRNLYRRYMSWQAVRSLCDKRRRYISLYSSGLRSGAAVGSKVQNQEIKDLDAQLEPEVIIVWRLLAHTQVETAKQREVAVERERLRGSHWWSFGWGSGTHQEGGEDSPEAGTPKGLTAAEWAKINELLEFQPGEERLEDLTAGEAPNMLATALDVTMRRNAARVVNQAGQQILEGAFEGFKVGLRFFPKTVEVQVKLDSYGLSAPEGTLVKSVRQEGRDGALTARFVHAPPGDRALDWSLSAGVAPCQVTFWKASLDRCVAFVQAGHAVSPVMSLETAAALESTFEAVRKTARDRVAAALEKRLRFAIDLDIDAPKVAIPVPAAGEERVPRTQLLLDFGHFTLRSDLEEHPNDLTPEELGLYSRFRVRASDISAWLVDGAYDWAQSRRDGADAGGGGPSVEQARILPVLDKCGLAAAVHQIHTTQVAHPTTRIAARVPTLGFHFSAARYERLMAVLRTLFPLEEKTDISSILGAPSLAFSKRDCAGEVQVLTWTGLGKTVAQWQPRYAVHAGMYLYLLEGESSRTYMRYTSLYGKQLVPVPPAAIGGWNHVVALCDRGADLSKVAESIHSLVLRFDSADSSSAWTSSLTQAIYKASVPLPLTIVGEGLEPASEEEEAEPVDAAAVKTVFFVGVLEELTVSLRGRATVAGAINRDRWGEAGILEMRALGGKVELVKRLFDLSIGVGLHSLEIEDVLYGHNGPRCRYIARSLLEQRADQAAPTSPPRVPPLQKLPIKLPERRIILEEGATQDSDDDGFADALEDFAGSPDSVASRRSAFQSPSYFDRQPLDAPEDAASDGLPSFAHSGGLLPRAAGAEPPAAVEEDFVTMQIVMRQPDSPEYDRLDTQLAIQVATLEFFCNRPTVVALTEFGTDVSTIQAALTAAQEAALAAGIGLVVYGLQGRGKVRTIFQLLLDMDTARVYLNLEDGEQLAVLAEERFHMDLKVFPASIRIIASLGNLRIGDLTLPAGHQYSWACDMRDASSSSLVELQFDSFSKDDDDYAGYEYGLRGNLQAVRLIFLYRFIQELMEYFQALATPDTGKVVQVVEDAGVERQIKQSELDGAVALKLDIMADAPVIKMPRTSDSNEFMQLDLGHLQLSNKFEWRGGVKEEPFAVRLDIMEIKGQDLQFLVGIDGQAGRPMFEDVQGVTVTVKRPLRDLFKRLPEVETDVQIQKLRAVMSDKEYLVITACAASNIAEPKRSIPTFRNSGQDSGGDAAAEVATVVDASSTSALGEAAVPEAADMEQGRRPPWTTNRVVVRVEQAELELFVGAERDASLASLMIRNLWQVYRSSSAGEQEVLLTLPQFAVMDNRQSTKSEMRFMVGSAIDVDACGMPLADALLGGAAPPSSESAPASPPELPRLTMLLLDYRATKTGRSLALRTQKPRLLVSLDFLLAVADFFVPSFHSPEASAATMRCDPVGMQGNVRLSGPEYVQETPKAYLSPERQLEVDGAHLSDFVYDGNGGSLYLLAEEGGHVVTGLPSAPLVLIGNGKRLRFRNVRIKGGIHLDACVHLGADSSYSAAPEDGCVIEDGQGEPALVPTKSGRVSEDGGYGSAASSPTVNGAELAMALDLQAVGLELTFYDTTKWPVGSVLRPEKLLRARTDFSCVLTVQGEEQRASAVLKGMRLEGGSGLTVIDPFNATLDFSKQKGKQDLSLAVSPITVRVTGNIVRLLQRLEADLVSTFHLGGDQVAARCSQFDRVWLNETLTSSQQQVAFWRPRVPPGYAIVGDCATSGAAPPSQSVMAVSTAFERVKRPVAYELVWSSSNTPEGSAKDASTETRTDGALDGAPCRECTVWLPVAPQGYVAVGCVAWRSATPPPLSLVACVRMDLLTSSSFSDCIYYVKSNSRVPAPLPSSSIWRMENAFGSFMAHMDVSQPPPSSAYDLREFLRYSQVTSTSTAAGSSAKDLPSSPSQSSRRMDAQGSARGKLESMSSKAGKYYSSVAHFERMWWDKGSDAKRHVSIWRPNVPTGYAMLGDYVTAGYEPPVGGLVMRDDGTGRLARPLGFKARAHLVGKNIEEASVWLPVAPPGYVALGCVGSRGFNPPDPDCVRCVRMDLVNQAHFQARPVWESLGKPGKGASSCSFWRVENQAGTFMVRSDLKPPPWRMAFGLAELGKPKLPENIAMDIKTGRISITAFDDFSGLMNPLADVSISGTNLLAHGRPELMNAVMITSMAASTFNSQLDAWEPAVEPWEGLVKWESNNDPSEQALPAGSRLRVAASSVVNVNVSSSCVETLVAAQLAWKRNAELEEDARKELQLALASGDDLADGPVAVEGSSALDQDDFARVTMENKLGVTVFVQAVDTDFASVQKLSAEECAVVRLPPPRFPELYTAGFTHQDETRAPRQFVAVRLYAGTDLPGAGVSDQEYLCALEVLSSQSRKGRDVRTLPQRARTRCVEPALDERGKQVTQWEEVFLFEIPSTAGKSELELTVLNQAAHGGRGEPVGATSIPLSDASEAQQGKWHVVREHMDARKGISWPEVEAKSFSLYVVGDQEKTPAGGEVKVALAFLKFSSAGDADEGLLQRSVQLGLSSEGPWTALRSVLALATYPERLGDAHFAVDVVLKQGMKFVELRSLVVLSNELDCPLEVCICPRALLDHADASVNTPADGTAVVVEEQFENQRFQPIRGWGSKWPGNFVLGDPSRWSTNDGLQSSQDFINIPLPPGWEWSSDWHVDKVGYVDIDGWAYNMDFKSLRWPPPTVKSRKKGPFDFVRRRRWIRTRRRVSDEEGGARLGVGVVPSGGTISMPWSSLQPGSDYCIQVRPQSAAGPTAAWHAWGRPVAKAELSHPEENVSNDPSGSGHLLRHVSGGLARLNSGPSLHNKDGVPGNVFQLRSLSKTEELLLCTPLGRSGEAPHGPAWLSMEADASILYSEINNPVHDWRLTVAAPLTVSNLLPVRAEYQIWEKPKRTAPVLRQRGVIESGASTQISSVDVRRPVFLSWWPQGAWKPERDLVLISDPTRLEAELPSSFLVSNTRSGRKLRISVEHDLGDSDVAAKRVLLYVPYWLKNEAGVPLSYRLTEVEDVGRASKVPRTMATPQPIRTSHASLLRVVKSLESIEDQQGLPVMLSLPSSERVGLSVSLGQDGVFSMAIPFRAFEEQLDRIDLNAVNSSGTYAKLSATIEMSSYGYERTKVIRLQPHTVFTNRLGQTLYVKQLAVPGEDVLGPAEVAKPLLWRSIYEQELVQVRTDSSRWSQPFSLAAEGMMHVTLRTVEDNSRQMIRAEIRNGVADSRFSVVFRACSAHGPHKLENRSFVLPIRFRQKGSDDSSWVTLRPGSSASFNWEDLLRERMVEVLVDGADPSTARSYGLDQVAEYPPLASTKGPVAALHCSVYREGASMVLRVEDWKPSTGDLAIVSRTPSFAGVGASSDTFESPGVLKRVGAEAGKEMEFHMLLDIHDLGVSIIDHTPEELLFMAVQGASVSYSTGLAGGITRFELQVAGLQIDNQLALTPMPVLMALEESANGVRPESVLKVTFSMQASIDHVQNYPYIGVQFAEPAWLLNTHEPIIWRLVEMVSRLKLHRLVEEQSTSVKVDPRVRIGLLNMTDLRFKLTLLIAPAQRPRGILGFWTSLVTSIGNTNEMQLNFQGRVREDIHMRQSQLVDSMMRGARNDLLGQPFHLLTGLDILGNLSSVVGTLSKGAAALSMDKKFIRSRQKQETKGGVEDLGDGLREGGEAFAKGLFRGVTGILTKPVEGFKASGIEGFASGVARGVIGVAAQPVSGVLDLVSKTTDGFNAQGRKISAAITSEQVLTRSRLPRAIGGDSILRPYDDYKARGQMIMQLAERGTYFGQYDIFKERAKFATSDAYEDHYNLPKNRSLIITHRRVLLLQHPTSLTGKRPDLMKEACSITWHVAWEDLLTTELLHSKHDPPGAPHSRVILHLRTWSHDARLFDTKEIARVVKCHPGTTEAVKIREAIQHAYETYGPDRATIAQLNSNRRTARKPYAGTSTGAVSGAALGLLAGPAAPIAVPIMATFGAIVGGAGQAILQADAAPEQDKHALPAPHDPLAGHRRGGSGMGGQHRRQASGDLPQRSGLGDRGHAALDQSACKLVRQFRLMWWDKGAAWSKNYPVSIWRPVAPTGYVVLGDVVQRGYDAPKMAMVFLDDSNGQFAQPAGYDLIWRDTDSGAREPVTIWRPRAPAGYVALGCVAVPDYYEPDRSIIRCIRQEFTIPGKLGEEPIWRDHKGAALWQCSLWQVDNQARTFLARRDHQRPTEDGALAVCNIEMFE